MSRVHVRHPKYNVIMQQSADWKRQFLKKTTYSDVNELLVDAVQGGLSRLFVMEVMQLRYRVEHRHTLDELDNVYATGCTPSWLLQLKPALWTLYSVMQSLCSRRMQKEDMSLRTITKRQREMLQGTRSVKCRRTRTVTVAAEHWDDLKVAMGSKWSGDVAGQLQPSALQPESL